MAPVNTRASEPHHLFAACDSVSAGFSLLAERINVLQAGVQQAFALADVSVLQRNFGPVTHLWHRRGILHTRESS